MTLLLNGPLDSCVITKGSRGMKRTTNRAHCLNFQQSFQWAAYVRRWARVSKVGKVQGWMLEATVWECLRILFKLGSVGFSLLNIERKTSLNLSIFQTFRQLTRVSLSSERAKKLSARCRQMEEAVRRNSGHGLPEIMLQITSHTSTLMSKNLRRHIIFFPFVSSFFGRQRIKGSAIDADQGDFNRRSRRLVVEYLIYNLRPSAL